MRGRLIAGMIVAFMAISNIATASKTEHENTGESGDRKAEASEFVKHHAKEDPHDFILFHYEGDNHEEQFVAFPLPVILVDGGLKCFMSSKFEYGSKIAESGGDYYFVHHGTVYKTDQHGTVKYSVQRREGDSVVTEFGEVLFGNTHGESHSSDDAHLENSGGHYIGLPEGAVILNEKPLDFSITKNVAFIMIVFLIMFVMFTRMARHYKTGAMPKKMGRFLEPVILYVRDDIAIPNIGEKKYKKYMPYLLTVFFFVWIVNLFGLTPLGVNVTNNLAVTAFLALMTYLITTFSGNKHYWGHIFWMPGVPVPMKFVLMPIELLGTIIKPFSLMIRLYANITAGHIVLGSLLVMVITVENWLGSSLSFVLSFVLGLLELLVAALQAYIFTMLSALYFGMAVEEHHAEAH